MNLTSLFSIANNSLSSFNNLVLNTYPQLGVFTISLCFYSIFVWFFYQNLSKRDLFELDLEKYEIQESRFNGAKKALGVLTYLVKYGIIFPLYVGFCFIVFSLLLFVMAKNIMANEIVLISMAFVSTIRIIAYLKTDLARDLAKLIPFAILAIFLTEANFFSWDMLIQRLGELPSLGWDLLGFLSFSVILEWILRASYFIHLKLQD